MLSAGALGGILGGLVAERVVSRFGKGATVLAECFLGGAAMAALGMTHSPFAAGLLYALISIGIVMGNVVIISLRRNLIPDELLGRVTSVYRLFVLGAVPLGAFLGGLLARGVDLAAPFWAGGALLMAATLILAPAISNARVREAEDRSEKP